MIWDPSPNFNDRHGPIQMVIMHATAGTNSAGHLKNPAPEGHPERAVSIHYLIEKDGTVRQMVKEEHRAWHAGLCRISWHPGADANDISIGIELENLNNGKDPYPALQWNAAVHLVQDIVTRRKIPQERLVRHRDVAIFPNGALGRKTDPNPVSFDWDRFVREVYGQSKQLITLLVTAGGLRLRDGTNTGAHIVRTFPSGKILYADRRDVGEDIDGHDGWYHIPAEGGWVSEKFVVVV